MRNFWQHVALAAGIALFGVQLGCKDKAAEPEQKTANVEETKAAEPAAAGEQVEVKTEEGVVKVDGEEGTVKIETPTGTVDVNAKEGTVKVEGAAGKVEVKADDKKKTE